MSVYKLARSLEELDPVARQLVADYFDFASHDMVCTPRQVLHGDVFFYAVALPIEFAL